MTPKFLVLLFAAIGLAPAVLWSLVSLATSVVSIVCRPVSLSLRLYSDSGARIGSMEYHELPLLTSLSILVGAALLFLGIASIPRAH